MVRPIPTLGAWYTHNSSTNNPFAINTVGVSVSIPLRIFDRNQGEKLRTQIDITRSEKLRDAAEAGVFSDVDSAYATLNSNVILLQPYKAKYLQQAVRVRDTMFFSYQHGGASLLDYLNAQSDYRTVELSYVNLVGCVLDRRGPIEYGRRPGGNPMKIKPRYAGVMLLAALCWSLSLLLQGCGETKADPKAEAPPAAKVEPDLDANNFKVDHPELFPVVKADEHKAAPALNVTGVVQPDIARAVPVISLASGRVVEIKARLGDAVKKGQLLLRVRSNDVSGAYQTYLKAAER